MKGFGNYLRTSNVNSKAIYLVELKVEYFERESLDIRKMDHMAPVLANWSLQFAKYFDCIR